MSTGEAKRRQRRRQKHRNRSHKGKIAYLDLESARNAAWRLGYYGVLVEPYPCQFCDYYHVGHPLPRPKAS